MNQTGADWIRNRISLHRNLTVNPLIAPLQYPLYSILDELHLMSEDQLQIILRSHEDGGFTWKRDYATIMLRDRLDAALDALLLLELAYEISIINSASADPADAIPGREALGCLIHSEAFNRYLNIYQYFGIRLLAGRIEPPWIPETDCRKPTCCAKTQTSRERNRQVLPLAPPPPLLSFNEEIINSSVKRLATLGDPRFEPMRKLLDGFTRSSDTTSLQLWLRGLSPDSHSDTTERLDEFVLGATHWTLILANLLRRLDLIWQYRDISNDPEEQKRRIRESLNGKDGPKLACPYISRFFITQIYWVAKLLRVEIDSMARVTCRETSWLTLMVSHWERKGNRSFAVRLRVAENLLRTALGRTCDLLQNAAEISSGDILAVVSESKSSKQDGVPFPWRAVFDRETRAIDGQRKKRNGLEEDRTKEEVPELTPGKPYWSEVHKNGFLVRDMFGIALSGGGIRSATFGLGVLQGLQEFDMLNYADVISTVSGGGFIGSWLVGNVKRSRHFLSKRNNWDESVKHLRKYANYLIPRSGLLSGDTWGLGALWLRNTLLIQLVAFAVILFLLAFITVCRLGFDAAASSPGAFSPSAVIAYAFGIGAATLLCYQFAGDPKSPYPSRWAIYIFGIVFSGIGAAGVAARLVSISETVHPVKEQSSYVLDVPVAAPWSKVFDLLGTVSLRISGNALYPPTNCEWNRPEGKKPQIVCTSTTAPALQAESQPWDYSQLLFQNRDVFSSRWATLVAFNFVGLLAITFLSLEQAKPPLMPLSGFHMSTFIKGAASSESQAAYFLFRLWGFIKRAFSSLLIALLSMAVVHLCLCALVYAMSHHFNGEVDLGRLWGFAVLPAGVLLSYCAGVLMLIGLSGVASDEIQREWWSRYTGLILALIIVMLAFCAVSVGGPWLIDFAINAFPKHPTAAKVWGGITWAAGIIGGLLAGRSSKTSGENPDKSIWMEILANVGGLLFVVATLLAGSEVLHVLWTAFVPGAENMSYAHKLMQYHHSSIGWTTGVLAGLVLLLGWRFDINVFSLNQLYRNRLVRCYLGATRTATGLRNPQPFTGFDFDDDLKLSDLGRSFRGPYPLLNCTLNLGGDADAALNTRHSDSFLFSPLFCGTARPGVGYAETYNPKLETQRYADITLGQAVSISGAAASPNMGYNTRPLVAYLLTLFNVRLRWWLPNPSKRRTGKGLGFLGFLHLLVESFGGATDHGRLLNVSDGGHFENLGIYELVRRRCRVIIASDAECDEELAFGSLGNVIRLCETDFGTTIDIDVSSLRKGPDGFSRSHCAIGNIRYGNGSTGYLIYLKANLTSDEDTSILQYHASHPSFPHQSTANQFYTEDQFESYRRLGLHTVRTAFRGIAEKTKPLDAAQKLSDRLIASAVPSPTFVHYTERLDGIWERFRQSPGCGAFYYELTGTKPDKALGPADPHAERCVGLELLQLMEDVFIELRLEDFWEHPDNRGWASLFMDFARSKRLREIWLESRRTMGIRFEQFCADKLGLPSERPIYRLRPLSQRG